MSSFEVGFCALGEYRNREQSRVNEEEFKANKLYTMMFRLSGLVQVQDAELEAAKFPIRIDEIERASRGVKVDFTILNADLHEFAKTQDKLFTDGYWTPEESAGITITWNGNNSIPASEGYLRNYDDDFGGSTGFLNVAKELTKAGTV